jgi:GDP-L-fucose synthase
MINKKPKIFIAGHQGMVGSAILRGLKQKHQSAVIITKSKAELDLKNQLAVNTFFQEEKPDQVYLCAAKVGGIHANNIYPADFIYDNLTIQTNVIHAAFSAGVKKLLFLGSSCIYPKLAEQPMSEEALLTGLLEPTNEPYAVAKIAGIKLCESYNRQYGAHHGISYRSVMPTNLYGPGDNYHPENSHVIPGLIRRFHESKIAMSSTVAVWGSGKPKREFLYVDDMAEASIFVMNLDDQTYSEYTEPSLSHINVGSGSDVSIAALSSMISETIGYEGIIVMDDSKPDGAPRKLMDSRRLNNLGWRPKVSMEEGLKLAYNNFLEQYKSD